MNIIKRKFRGLIHRRILPKWVQRTTWNHEYVTGQWDLRNLRSPNDPIYELLAKYCADRDICDIGSGLGNTITEMPPIYRTYTGMDISDVALSIAAKRAAEAGRERVTFVQGFMHTFTPNKKPDVLLFRESLMYVSRRRSHIASDMAGFLRRYAAMLAPGGIMIARICISTPGEEYFAAQVETVVRQNFEVIECRRTQEPPSLLLVFQPSRPRAGRGEGNIRASNKRRSPDVSVTRMTPFDASGAFRPTAVGNELRRLAIRGAAATVSASGVGLAVQVVSTVILARLLKPADFGVVTMVTTFSLLLASFGLNGLTEAVIQFEEVDHYTASNLFWLNSGAGLVLAIAFVPAGSLLARFYRNPLVANAAMGLSLAIFIGAVSVVHLALLKRAMRFAATSTNDLVGRVVYSAVPILLASRGWGYWALVAGIVTQQLSMTVGAWWLCRWVPSLPRWTSKTGAMVRFAAKVYGQFIVRYSTQNVDNLLVGWYFNAAALGFYKKAYDLFLLSASQLIVPLNNVALVTLSRLNQDPVRFRRYLANSLGIIAFVGMAASADLTLVGKDVVRLVLGPQWSESVRIFELFGPGIGVMLLYGIVGWIHLSIAKPGRLLRWSLVEFALTVSLFLAALPWGPAGIAAAWSVSYWTLLIPGFWYAGRPIGFGVSALIAAIWRFAAASLLAGLATAAIIRGTLISASPVGAGAALEAIIIISSLFVTLYVGTVILLHWGCAPLRQLASLLRELAPSRKSTRPAAEPV